MDRIDSFIIHVRQRNGGIEFTFIIVEEDISLTHINNLIDYIDGFVRNLNVKIPQFSFSWEEAHRTKPRDITAEIIHQILVQKVEK